MTKNILTINLSPRKNGTSVVLLKKCTDYLKEHSHFVKHINLYSHLENFQELFNSVSDADTLIFSGPDYVNTYPADTTKLLEEIAVELKKHDIHYHTCHCTGEEAYNYLSKRVPNMKYLACGEAL